MPQCRYESTAASYSRPCLSECGFSTNAPSLCCDDESVHYAVSSAGESAATNMSAGLLLSPRWWFTDAQQGLES